PFSPVSGRAGWLPPVRPERLWMRAVRCLVRQHPPAARSKAWASAHSSRHGQADAIATLILRTLTVTSAPIFKSFRRIRAAAGLGELGEAQADAAAHRQDTIGRRGRRPSPPARPAHPPPLARYPPHAARR